MPRPTPRADILSLAPYPSAAAVESVGGRAPIRLNQNECAARPSERVVAAFSRAAADANRYPDPACGRLRARIAEAHGLDAARIVCGNGSGELLGLLARAYAGEAGRGDEILSSQFAYLYFDTAARLAGAAPRRAPAGPDLGVDIEALLAAVTKRTRVVCVDNPGNPTGAYLPGDALRALRRGLRDDILLVLDSAYAEYATAADYDAGAALVEAGENTVMLRTFSKIYGLAAARVGWAYGPAAAVAALNRARLPNNIAGPSQAAATAALADEERPRIADLRAENDQLRRQFCAQLNALGWRAYPSQGSYVLAQFADAAAARATDAALRARGIHARPMAAYDLPDCIRFTVGAPAEMAAATDAVGALATVAGADATAKAVRRRPGVAPDSTPASTTDASGNMRGRQ